VYCKKLFMLSLFANKINRVSTGSWDPNKFKIDAPEVVYPSVGCGGTEPDPYPAYYPNYPYQQQQPQPQGPLFDPRLYRAMDHIGPEISQFIQPSRQTRENFRQVIKPLETSNLAVNPVENLESSYGIKTGPSAPQQLKEEWSNRYCDDAIGSKYLTERSIGSYELMGLNEAQRRSRPMGEGVPNIGPAVPFDQTNSQNYGRGPVAMSTLSQDLYHADFATLGGPPAVYTGIYTDPLTGIQYDTYESAMPPPDGDWYDMSYSSGKNRKIDCLQGGWSNNTPIPPRKEILEGDWNQQYNRGIMTYGGGGEYADVMRCKVMDNLERSVRFTMNDFTPDNEAPELTGVPANVDGIYGNVKVRFNPRLTGTNRGGYKEETTYRTGASTNGYHNNKMAQEFTKSPQCRAPLEYMGPVDGYGAHSTHAEQERSEYNPANELRGLETTTELSSHGMGYVDTYGEQSRSDYDVPTKQSGLSVNSELSEHGLAYAPYAVQGRSEYNTPTRQTGLDVNDELYQHGVSDGGAQALQNRMEYNTPTRQAGLDVNDELYQHGVSNGGAHAVQSRLEYNTPTRQAGLDVNDELYQHGVSNGGAQAVQNRAEYNTPTRQAGLDVNDELYQHGVALVDTYGEQSRSDYEVPNKFTGTTVDPELSEHGVHGGNAYATQNRQALTRHNRIALLKFMQGAIKTDTDGAMNRVYPTRFNDRKNTTNTVLIPSRMTSGLGGPQTVERVPTEWSYRRKPTGHRPTEEHVGNVRKAVENNAPIIGQFPVKFEIDQMRMGPAFSNNGFANETLYDTIIRATGPCMTY
jgi:hypothetical protein